MKELFKKLKQLTGIKYVDIAKDLGTSKQMIFNSINNYSIVHINANKWILNNKIDEVIHNYQEKIQELEQLKQEINRYKTK